MLERPTIIGDPSQPSLAADQLFGRAVSQMGPDWIVLRDVPIAQGAKGREQSPQERVRYALLHPRRGIVLLDVAPKRTPDAVERARRALAAANFHAIFAGHLPIVYLRLSLEDVLHLGEWVDAAFAQRQAIGLHGGHAWTGLARRVFGGEIVSEFDRSDKSGAREGFFTRLPTSAEQHPVVRSPGLRALGYFWLAVLGAFAGAAAFLQYTYDPVQAGPETGSIQEGGSGPDTRTGLAVRKQRRPSPADVGPH